MKYKITNEQKQEGYLKAVELNKIGFDNDYIIENTIFPSWRVLEFYMSQNGLKLPYTNRNVFKVNNNYFDSIDSQEKAYILGFIYADGCVYDENRFGFCIQEDDNVILELIKKEISPESNIKTIHNKKGAKNRKPQSILRITSRKIIEVLNMDYGVVKNKTTTESLKFPNFSGEFQWAFIRGLIDGDGCISLNKNSVRIYLCMTDKPFLLELQLFLKEQGINSTLIGKQGKTCIYYILNISIRKEVELFCIKMYENSKFHLDRKYNKFREHLIKRDNTELNKRTKKLLSV